VAVVENAKKVSTVPHLPPLVLPISIFYLTKIEKRTQYGHSFKRCRNSTLKCEFNVIIHHGNSWNHEKYSLLDRNINNIPNKGLTYELQKITLLMKAEMLRKHDCKRVKL